ncbi:PH domain-containing protein [Kandleria vitulina]|jgi:uncharacterized membrane protein YdbT with pleckstrin-like domain|uniref:PH domain-containing protein n=1 Tax=Kandleria vitulina TaxID=1630 RepID=UPI000EE1AB9A|nr:hypothetical protein [Kandleria vitulina]
MGKVLWHDRKRTFCGLPWSFTTYTLESDRFVVEKGFLSRKEYDVRLYRILNINLSRSLSQRLFGLGTIHIDSNDKDLGSFDLLNIKKSKKVKELISEQVEAERRRNRVTAREFMMDMDDQDDDFNL